MNGFVTFTQFLVLFFFKGFSELLQFGGLCLVKIALGEMLNIDTNARHLSIVFITNIQAAAADSLRDIRLLHVKPYFHISIFIWLIVTS